jgi:uncharacterized protein (TIGR03067 family)
MRLHALLPAGFALLLTLTDTVTAGKDKGAAIEKDLKALEGVWQVVELEVDGNKGGAEDVKKITVVNEPNGKWRIEAEGKVVARGASNIDPTAKPKTLDITMTEGEGVGQTTLGIYELGKDTRKVCIAQAGKPRPTEFSSPSGSGQILVVLKRVKK